MHDAAPPELKILYRDNGLIAINKPAGLLVHRSAIDFHETVNARDQLQNQIGTDVFPLHRLDKPTSGVQLFALDKSTATLTSEQFRNQTVSKYYVAVVRGYTDREGTIENLVKDRDALHKPGKEATTHYRQLARIELPVSIDGKYATSRYSIVEVKPLSGRRHQIRQHMKHISHPLIGDTSYGKSLHNKFFIDFFSSARLLLHAERLALLHPHTGQEVTIVAHDYDKPFSNVLRHVDWEWTSDKTTVCRQLAGVSNTKG